MATLEENIIFFMTVWGTLCVYSYTFKDNPFWKWATNTLVAGYIAYSAVVNIDWLLNSIIVPMTKQMNYIHLIGILVGFLWYFRFWKKYFYIYRYALAMNVGASIGISIPRAVRSSITQQVGSTMIKLYGTGTLLGDFTNFVIVFSVITAMIYFIFTIKHEGPVGTPIGWISKAGRWVLIVTFGVAFGNTINSRMALLLGTIYTLMMPNNRIYFGILGTIILGYLIGTELLERRKVAPEIVTAQKPD